ncbi:Uncharacterized conserved protein YukE [Georgenia satyanarayanai]|uniref:Uncharacterized conserved protein YukE n=1 Tax=Georgenia satyanarayanai TaxID=860221 RepID=A0A2Y9A730_9MICO|nr:hypothetical protein [Georgenia satyanarayanai]PYG00959.1 uncharacterized protein YukE [Georgenia satyanarayanai]SSA39198.1 Uncharacterized conserved protein YukE [Georgenia satyanarayanai]
MGPAETPEELHALAGQMDDVGVQARELGADLLALRETIGWRSPAAEEYQATLLDHAATTTRGADRVDDVARALREHADGAAQTLAAIEAARSFLLSAAEEARSVLATLWDGVVDAEDARRVLDVVADAPSSPLDPGWLERARQAGWPG